MSPTYELDQSLEDDLLAQLTPLSEAELGIKWDELSAIAIAQPDDVLAIEGLKQVLGEVISRGQIGQAMEMAMSLGAMACLHPHLENLSNELGKTALDSLAQPHHDDKDSDKDKDKNKHNPNNCSDCRNGRPCRRK